MKSIAKNIYSVYGKILFLQMQSKLSQMTQGLGFLRQISPKITVVDKKAHFTN
jgi:hypothetical protein